MAAHYPSVQRDHLSPYKHSAMKPENGRRVLGELAPNATTPRRPQHATVTGKQWSQSTSPTKRNAIVLGDEPSAKKRRNVEQGITVIPYKPLGEKTATKVSAERKVLQQPVSRLFPRYVEPTDMCRRRAYKTNLRVWYLRHLMIETRLQKAIAVVNLKHPSLL